MHTLHCSTTLHSNTRNRTDTPPPLPSHVQEEMQAFDLQWAATSHTRIRLTSTLRTIQGLFTEAGLPVWGGELREIYFAFATLSEECQSALVQCPYDWQARDCNVTQDRFNCALESTAYNCTKEDSEEFDRILRNIGCVQEKGSSLFTYFLGVGFPVFTLLMLLAWLVAEFFNRSDAAIAITAAVCCVCIFFPFGVLLPSVLASQFKELVKKPILTYLRLYKTRSPKKKNLHERTPPPSNDKGGHL